MLAMTCTLFNYTTNHGLQYNYHKKTKCQREKKPQGMIHVEFCRAAFRRTVISFKDSEYGD